MPKETWMIACGLTVALLLGLLGLSSWEKKREVERVRAEMEAARRVAAKAETETSELRNKLAEGEARIQELQKEKATVLQTHLFGALLKWLKQVLRPVYPGTCVRES